MHWIFSRTMNAFLKPCFAQCKSEQIANKNNGRHLWAYSTNKPSSFRGPDRAGGCKQLRRMDVQFHWYSFLKITSNKQQPFNHAWSCKRWNHLKSNKHVPDHVPDKEMRLDDRLRGAAFFLAEVPLSGQILVISIWGKMECTSFNGNWTTGCEVDPISKQSPKFAFFRTPTWVVTGIRLSENMVPVNQMIYHLSG